MLLRGGAATVGPQKTKSIYMFTSWSPIAEKRAGFPPGGGIWHDGRGGATFLFHARWPHAAEKKIYAAGRLAGLAMPTGGIRRLCNMTSQSFPFSCPSRRRAVRTWARCDPALAWPARTLALVSSRTHGNSQGELFQREGAHLPL